MAFKQPRVPQETGGTLAGYVKNIALFLRDFCTAQLERPDQAQGHGNREDQKAFRRAGREVRTWR